MRTQPYYARLSFLAFMLLVVSRYFPTPPWHGLLQCTGVGLLIWAIVLMYLRRTGRSNWNGPSWGGKLSASPKFKRVLIVVPALCAAWVPILFLLNRRWGLSDGQLGMTCGVLLGISLVSLKFRKSAASCCSELPEPLQTQQGGTK
jgi:carbon starvation protein CstA